MGNTARRGTDQRGEGVTDSHATPVPSRLPPPPRGRELHPLALPPRPRGQRLPASPPRSQSPRCLPETPLRLPWGHPSAPALPRRRPGGGGGPSGRRDRPTSLRRSPQPRGSWKVGSERTKGGESPAPLGVGGSVRGTCRRFASRSLTGGRCGF